MKKLSILVDEKKLDLNNSGSVLLARLIPIHEIKLKKEFQELFPLNPANVIKITQRIKENGYDATQPIHIWEKDGSHILIDGHHRREGAIGAGLYEIPCCQHEFSSIESALEYAISLQTERRNLSDVELLKALKIVDTLKSRGLGAEGEKGKSAARSAQILGISTSRVEKLRTVEKYATDEIKAKIESGEYTLNKAYLLIRDSLKDTPTEKAGKKPSKELIKFLRVLQKHLEENNIDELHSLIDRELEKADER